MHSTRRGVLKLLAVGGVTVGTSALPWSNASAEQGKGARSAPDLKKIKSIAFDAYGTLFDLDADKRKQLMEAYLSLAPFADVVPGLEQLKEAGFKLAILSNGAPRMLQAAAKSAGVDRLLSRIISVDEIKIYKPSPRVYELATKRLGTPREATGFVSSNAWDAAGAANVGLPTFWINRGKQPMEELGLPADREVEKITDVLPLLKAA
jgi:2-haloacid dehalogenase